MGVNVTKYAILGYKLPFPENDSDAEELMDLLEEKELGSFKFIFDGMGGDYIVFGLELFNGGDERWGETGDGFKSFDLKTLQGYTENIKRKFKEFVPSKYHDMIKTSFVDLHIFSHYS